MSYLIRLIGEHELPAGQDWALVEHGDRTLLFVKESAVGPRMMAEAWGAYRMMDRRRTLGRQDEMLQIA